MKQVSLLQKKDLRSAHGLSVWWLHAAQRQDNFRDLFYGYYLMEVIRSAHARGRLAKLVVERTLPQPLRTGLKHLSRAEGFLLEEADTGEPWDPARHFQPIDPPEERQIDREALSFRTQKAVKALPRPVSWMKRRVIKACHRHRGLNVRIWICLHESTPDRHRYGEAPDELRQAGQSVGLFTFERTIRLWPAIRLLWDPDQPVFIDVYAEDRDKEAYKRDFKKLDRKVGPVLDRLANKLDSPEFTYLAGYLKTYPVKRINQNLRKLEAYRGFARQVPGSLWLHTRAAARREARLIATGARAGNNRTVLIAPHAFDPLRASNGFTTDEIQQPAHHGLPDTFIVFDREDRRCLVDQGWPERACLQAKPARDEPEEGSTPQASGRIGRLLILLQVETENDALIQDTVAACLKRAPAINLVLKAHPSHPLLAEQRRQLNQSGLSFLEADPFMSPLRAARHHGVDAALTLYSTGGLELARAGYPVFWYTPVSPNSLLLANRLSEAGHLLVDRDALESCLSRPLPGPKKPQPDDPHPSLAETIRRLAAEQSRSSSDA
ncbi:MAG: hypothetical protein ACFE0O_15545 [Opitutales bacterium]